MMLKDNVYILSRQICDIRPWLASLDLHSWGVPPLMHANDIPPKKTFSEDYISVITGTISSNFYNP